MTNPTNPSELYQAIERAALSVYGELLSEELANNAAQSFATETTAMVQDLLDDGVAALREKIQGQLAALNGTGKSSKKKTGRKSTGTKSPRAKKASAKKVEASSEKSEPAKKAESSLVAAAKKADKEAAEARP